MTIDWSRMISPEAAKAQSAQIALQKRLDAALGYLAETDWQVMRAAEGGAAMSKPIKTARAKARLEIDCCRQELTALGAAALGAP